MAFGLFGARFDLLEFVFGFVLGVLVIWGGRRLKPVAKIAIKWVGEQFTAMRENVTASTADPYIRDLQFRLENNHLANPLFSLPQILIPPRLLLPKAGIDPTVDGQPVDRYHAIIPPLPDWNTLSGIYRTPSIPANRIFDISANVLITGEIGSGKSTALAYLALETLQARGQRVSDEQRTVILIHTNDLLPHLEQVEENLLKPLISAARQGSTASVSGFIPRFLNNQLETNQTVILIDGFDEMVSDQMSQIGKWLEGFIREYPQHKVIAAGPPRGYNGLLKAGRFIPLAIAPWSKTETKSFLSKWAHSWQASVQPSLPKGAIAEVDPALLNAWLQVAGHAFNPLEMTLKVWSAYIGDLQSSKVVNTIRAYVRRMISPNEQNAAQLIALNWIRAHNGPFAEETIDQHAPLSDLFEAKILRRHAKGLITFSNPNVGSYLAAQAFSLERGFQIEFNEDWQPAAMAVRYYASSADMSVHIKGIKAHMNDPLKRALFSSAAWLRDAPSDVAWRNHILSPMAKLIQDDNQPYRMRLRALDAIVAAEEKSAQALFNKMVQSTSKESRILGALGLGGLCATESVPDLISFNVPEEFDDVRFAICLALAVIGSSQALIGLGKWLIEGDDVAQLFSAEALASHDGEGISMLEDATTMDGVRIRRAAVHGLSRVLGSRVDQILKGIEREDDQAIVRNAATEVLEQRQLIPGELSAYADDPSNLPWLVAYAAEGGIGLSPGKGALETLRRALMAGSNIQRIAALEAISKLQTHELILDTLKAMEAEDMEVKDAAYNALWHLEASGANYESAFKSNHSS
jgi:hypothetical protein